MRVRELLTRGVFSKGTRQCGELGGVFQSFEETAGNSTEANLRADEGAGKDAAGLVLSAAVKRIEHRPLEIVVKARGEIIRDR